MFSESFYTTVHSTNMPLHYFHIDTSASSVTCSSSTTKTSPFNLAILHDKNIANASSNKGGWQPNQGGTGVKDATKPVSVPALGPRQWSVGLAFAG